MSTPCRLSYSTAERWASSTTRGRTPETALPSRRGERRAHLIGAFENLAVVADAQVIDVTGAPADLQLAAAAAPPGPAHELAVGMRIQRSRAIRVQLEILLRHRVVPAADRQIAAGGTCLEGGGQSEEQSQQGQQP